MWSAALAACPRGGPGEGVWGNREVPPVIELVIRLLHQSCIAMNAALELVRARPASRAFVLACEDGSRARDAADRRIARVVQRVVRNLVYVDVGLDAFGVPV